MENRFEKKYNAVKKVLGVRDNEPGALINKAREQKVVINKMEPKKRTAFMGMI